MTDSLAKKAFDADDEIVIPQETDLYNRLARFAGYQKTNTDLHLLRGRKFANKDKIMSRRLSARFSEPHINKSKDGLSCLARVDLGSLTETGWDHPTHITSGCTSSGCEALAFDEETRALVAAVLYQV